MCFTENCTLLWSGSMFHSPARAGADAASSSPPASRPSLAARSEARVKEDFTGLVEVEVEVDCMEWLLRHPAWVGRGWWNRPRQRKILFHGWNNAPTRAGSPERLPGGGRRRELLCRRPSAGHAE